jgi:ribonuclease PH
MPRLDGRKADQLREVTVKVDEFRKHDTLITYGATTVYCYASIEDRVPGWLVGAGCGWLTAEYNMLPSASDPRQQRERQRMGGRTFEIQRLVGRSLRAALDLDSLPPMSITVDCDVIVADGGTRTASITGGMIALANLLHSEGRRFNSNNHPLKRLVAAVSCGIVKGEPCLDLNYVEDRDAQVDANIVGLSSGGFAEVQATNEHGAFDRAQLDQMLSLVEPSLMQLYALQRQHIKFNWL